MLPSSSLPLVRFLRSSVGQFESRVHALDDKIDFDWIPMLDFLVAEEVGRDDDEGREGRRETSRRHRPKGGGERGCWSCCCWGLRLNVVELGGGSVEKGKGSSRCCAEGEGGREKEGVERERRKVELSPFQPSSFLTTDL